MNKDSICDPITFLECAACGDQFDLEEPLDNDVAEMVISATLLCGDCNSNILNIDSVLYE